MRPRIRTLALAATAAALAGCGPSNGLTLARVSGKVTHAGEPITYGTVFFMPDDARGTVGPPAMATLSADGSFTLSTEEPGDGAIVGDHKVGVVGLDPRPINPEAAPTPEAAPQDFMKARAKQSKKRVARPDKKADTFTDKGGRVYRYVIPKGLGNPQESGLTFKVERGSNRINIVVGADGRAQITQ